MNQQLRLQLCKPPIVDSTGNVNHEYFKVRPGQYWSDDDQHLLETQLKLHGVSNMSLIADAYLGRKTQVELELRTCIHLGTRDLATVDSFQGRAEQGKDGRASKKPKVRR